MENQNILVNDKDTDSIKSDNSSDGTASGLSPFIKSIIEKLKEKKKISEVSIKVYLRNLKKLNNNTDITDNKFEFLKDTPKVIEKLSNFKETTKRNYLISIVSILSLFKDGDSSPGHKELHDTYHSMMMVKRDLISDAISTGSKSETQELNWIDWESVKTEHKNLGVKVDSFYKRKSITPEEFQTLTAYMILSLYCLIPPRRNKDYCLMRVVDTFKPELDQNFNYLDLVKKKFIFNNYKTSKKYGRFDLVIPRALMLVVNKYIKHRASKFPLDDNDNKPFLVKPDGSALDKSNDITKTLNKVFGKAIGSSMLRHIFLTDKYSTTFKQAKIDSEIMGHSSEEQKKYIKEKLTITV